jgi:2-oxoglutarate ferredoxin oxidoreductase subunit gamma
VIIADEDIDYPKAINVDIFLALTQKSFDSYRHDVKPGAIAVIDSTSVKTEGEYPFRIVGAPIVKIAEEKLGRMLYANLVALGMVIGVSHVVPVGAVQAAIRAIVPKGTEAKNLEAFEIGLTEAAQQLANAG